MKWPFKRKYPAVEQFNVADDWRVFHGDYKGKPLIARFNHGLGEVSGHPQYRYQVGIAVPLRAPNEHGLPDVQEDRALALIEDRIAADLQTGRESILAGVITTNGMREFVLYTTSPASVKARFDGLQGSIASHSIQLMIQEDREWNVYRQFVES